MANAPQQHLFVSNRDITVTSVLGYSLAFEKGVPMHVPRAMHPEVMEKGILPCDGEGHKVDPPAPEDVKVMVVPEDAEERNDAILEAIKQLVARNNSKDFSAGGVPTAPAVRDVLGWRVDPQEVTAVWRKHKPDLIKAK